MKKLSLLGIILFAILKVSLAQNTFPASGNVGIGTSTPADLLDVKGYAQFGPSLERNSIGSGSLGFNRRVQDGYVFNNNSFAYQIQHIGNSNQGTDFLTFQIYYPNANSVNYNALVINSSGNIGIGITNPDEKLTIYGTVHARAVKVDLNGPLADFVFDNAYKLPTLNSVHTYVSKFHHLEGIPSAADAEKNGLNLGDMNQKLLQKVEELTLYLIQQQKEIDSLKKQIKYIHK